MRYYSFAIKATQEAIREGAKKSKITLNDYNYDSPIGALNSYMYRNMKNGITFLVYREEGAAMLADFSFDEKKNSLHEAYNFLVEILSSKFSIKVIKNEPCEITMSQFYEDLNEARRRGILNVWGRVTEEANVEFYEIFYRNAHNSKLYELKEKIISDKVKKDNPMYDESVKKELATIESHQNLSDFKGNLVHYFISSKSMQAANDITEAVMQRLAKANRISGRRMEIISEIDPKIYNGHNYLEKLIENNYGGVIVFDLSGKFGCSPSDYGMACKYIEKLVIQYKNDCLFVFTYNTDKPGFAYELLRTVSKYVIPVKLREGTGGRKQP